MSLLHMTKQTFYVLSVASGGDKEKGSRQEVSGPAHDVNPSWQKDWVGICKCGGLHHWVALANPKGWGKIIVEY